MIGAQSVVPAALAPPPSQSFGSGRRIGATATFALLPILLVPALAGCGQKGPLVLAPAAAASAPPAPAAARPAAAPVAGPAR